MKSFCALILVSALVAGCSGNDNNASTASDATKSASPQPAADSQAPAAPAPAAQAASADPGEKFLADNAKKDGVKTTSSGLQYLVMKSGTGLTPKATDKVTVHYHGTLIDGTVFDSSVDRGEPASFGVTQVIPGWVEALQMMKVGDKWKLFIPAKLAYGDQSPSPKIPPNSVLIFEVELLAINQS